MLASRWDRLAAQRHTAQQQSKICSKHFNFGHCAHSPCRIYNRPHDKHLAVCKATRRTREDADDSDSPSASEPPEDGAPAPGRKGRKQKASAEQQHKEEQQQHEEEEQGPAAEQQQGQQGLTQKPQVMTLQHPARPDHPPPVGLLEVAPMVTVLQPRVPAEQLNEVLSQYDGMTVDFQGLQALGRGALAAGATWIVRQATVPHVGAYQVLYDMETQEWYTDDDPVEQLLTASVLATPELQQAVGELVGQQTYEALGDSVAECLMRFTSFVAPALPAPQLDHQSQPTGAVCLNPVKVGGMATVAQSAAMVLAIVGGWHVPIGLEDADFVEMLALGIMQQQREDGTFRTTIMPHTNLPDEAPEVQGPMACCALVAAFEASGEQLFLEAAMKGIQAYQHILTQEPLPADTYPLALAWQARALARVMPVVYNFEHLPPIAVRGPADIIKQPLVWANCCYWLISITEALLSPDEPSAEQFQEGEEADGAEGEGVQAGTDEDVQQDEKAEAEAAAPHEDDEFAEAGEWEGAEGEEEDLQGEFFEGEQDEGEGEGEDGTLNVYFVASALWVLLEALPVAVATENSELVSRYTTAIAVKLQQLLDLQVSEEENEDGSPKNEWGGFKYSQGANEMGLSATTLALAALARLQTVVY